jgi:hypothetical protein
MSIMCFIFGSWSSRSTGMQHVRGRAREEERLVPGVVPPDDEMVAAIIDAHREDLTLPRFLAHVHAVDDELVSNLGVHGHLLGDLTPIVGFGGSRTEGPGVTSPWDGWPGGSRPAAL